MDAVDVAKMRDDFAEAVATMDNHRTMLDASRAKLAEFEAEMRRVPSIDDVLALVTRVKAGA